MKGFRLTFAVALLIVGLSWSSWLAFSTGFKASELSLELLGDVFEVFKAPLLAGNNSIVDAPQFSVLPLPLDGTATPSGTGGINFHPFNEAYVVSLSRRSDRRIAMERIRQVIPRLNWTYVDATGAEDPIVSRILDRARAQRSRESEQFSWPDDPLSPAQGPLGHTGADLWSVPSLEPPGPSLSDTNADLRPKREPLTCAQQNSTRGPIYSAAVPPYLVLTRSKLACWHSHAAVLRRIAEGGPEEVTDEGPGSREVALVLEDDVDIERDLFERLGEVWGHLPPAWDMLYLGTVIQFAAVAGLGRVLMLMHRTLLVQRDLPRSDDACRQQDVAAPFACPQVHSRIRGHASRGTKARGTPTVRAVCVLACVGSGVRLACLVRAGQELLGCPQRGCSAEGDLERHRQGDRRHGQQLARDIDQRGLLTGRMHCMEYLCNCRIRFPDNRGRAKATEYGRMRTTRSRGFNTAQRGSTALRAAKRTRQVRQLNMLCSSRTT